MKKSVVFRVENNLFWLLCRVTESEDGRNWANDEWEEDADSWYSTDSTSWLWHRHWGLSALSVSLSFLVRGRGVDYHFNPLLEAA